MTETTASNSKILCLGCNREIFNHQADGKRVPCPICGSVRRAFKDIVECHMAVAGR